HRTGGAACATSERTARRTAPGASRPQRGPGPSSRRPVWCRCGRTRTDRRGCSRRPAQGGRRGPARRAAEGLVDAFARGVGAGPQVAAGALLARVEPGPEFLATLGALLDEEAGVVDVEPGHDAAEEAVGPVVRGGVALHLAQQLREIVPRPLLTRHLESVALEHVEVEIHVRGVEVQWQLVERALVHERLDEAGMDIVEVVAHRVGVAARVVGQAQGAAGW